MPGPGDIFYQSMVNAGESIGSAIGEMRKKKQQHDQTTEMVELFAKTPRNPDAPPGSPESKPLLDLKTYQFLKGELKTKGASADAAIQAYMSMGQKLAFEGAKARLKSEQVGTGPEFVHTGEGTFFRGSKGWQRVPGGPTAGQTGVQQRWQQKELDRGITGIQKELEAADITDPAFLLDSDRHKGGYLKDGTFVPSAEQKTHIQVETDDGSVNMPVKKFEHLKRKAIEWKEFKRQKTMPHADQAGGGLPVLSPKEAASADPGTVFRTLDGRVKKVPGGKTAPVTAPADDNGTDSADSGSDE
jgi:hypothetical protein